MRCSSLTLLLLLSAFHPAAPGAPLEPFQPDDHTLLLYHFDEGQGVVARDASKYGYDGEVRGALWVPGKFGKALFFDGKDDCVYRQITGALEGLRQVTVECWFNQENPTGRQFLVGKDVTFHFDFSEGSSTSMSLYNKGGAVKNDQGLPHQHLGTGVGSARLGRWHHNAVTYDGQHLSFFFDGALKHRVEAARDFSLGVQSRGLWVGCYVGMDFWFSGTIDEVRVSDCIRYDPEKKLKVGGQVFEMPRKARPLKAVRRPQKTGLARLELTLKKLYGGNVAGWVYLKPPGQRAVIVGQYALKDLEKETESKLELDVSDEVSGDGCYVLGLEVTDAFGYFAVLRAALVAGGRTLAQWSGEAKARRTFNPPVLVPLQVRSTSARNTEHGAPSRILLLPQQTDRIGGDLEIDDEDAEGPPCLVGDGYAEYWLDLPVKTTYRVYLRYATAGLRPCDLVIDGDDLNDYSMCALNRTERSRPRDAFWEYQGTTTLTPGLHWLRIQDVLPDIVALRLEPVLAFKRPAVPWGRYAAPDGSFLTQPARWEALILFGSVQGSTMELASGDTKPALRFSATFSNTDKGELFAGDSVRLLRKGSWDLEPFGRLKLRFEGQASGHVIALRVVDVKGNEKLLWRSRDTEPGPREVIAPISFEGNDVFDPGHVVAVCVDLDEGNVKADQVNQFSGALVGPVFERRDAIAWSEGYAALLAKARESMTATMRGLGTKALPLLSPGFRPWTRPVVPEEHPLYARTEPKPVTRKTVGYNLHSTGARGISPETLDDFHKHYSFGDVCWPHIGICPQRKDHPTDAEYQKALQGFEKLLEGVRDRGLYLFDIWGYVPYEYPFKITPEHHEILTRVLGDRFLGYDNGEQDGRYIGSYAGRGKATVRKEGWDDFLQWDKHICDESMNYMNATGSLNFSHYYGERGCRTLGLETAQGLPSDTLMFAFLRGASKQYGRLTTQATSIWNRFGYNIYSDRRTDGANGYGYGPNKGCSRSLHKRLFLSSYLGGDSIVGTETSQFTADRLENGAPELSPLGKQHLDIMAWVKKHPDRGVMYTPVAFMLDFHNGWNMPRHLYRGDKYKVWGKFPYEKGDYLIDAMFRIIWPGYEDCSYLRNERGFITPTPYGDLFDVLTNRCHPDILKQYTSLMLLGDVEITPEVVRNLTDFVQSGGDLLIDAGNAKGLPESLLGVKPGQEAKATVSHVLSTGQTLDEQPYTYTILTLTSAAPLLVNEGGHPLITVNRTGKGRVIVGAVDYWMTDALTYRVPEIVNMEAPYRLLKGVRAVLDMYFDSFNPIEVEPKGLNVRTCCYAKDTKRLLVGLMNNDLFADWRGTLRLRRGQVASVHELWRNKALPATPAIPLTLPAGDVAILDLRVK